MAKDNRDYYKVKNSWSEIKDTRLGYYLEPYFQKILMTRRPIYYVDCFAGKGKFEDGKPGSPLIALKARDDCLRKTERRDKQGAIKTCFIDLNHAGELQKNIDEACPTYDKPEIISGKYEEEIENCLRNKRGYNVFLYIDPYGIKELDSNLFDKFGTFGFKTFEMLINFNSFGFFRNACRVMKVDCDKDNLLFDLDELVEYDPTEVQANAKSSNLLTQIAGGDYWKDIVTDYQDKSIDGYQAECRLSTEYKQRLKQQYSYVLDMPIRLRSINRPKYRMIHVCDHEDGCFLMAQNMQKRKDELFLNIQNRGQISLFDFTQQHSISAEGVVITEGEIEEKVKEFLCNVREDISITKFLASFMNENGLICNFQMIYNTLERMKSSGQIDIIRNPALTPRGKESSFWEEKKNKTVTIRRHKI